jgi:hypothetical protein
LVLAVAQFFLLTGFGKGPLGFLPSEHGKLSTPEAWSKAIHSAVAQSIMGKDPAESGDPVQALEADVLNAGIVGLVVGLDRSTSDPSVDRTGADAVLLSDDASREAIILEADEEE